MQQDKPGNNQQNVKPAEQNTNTDKSMNENVALAHEQAEVDMINDAELNNEPDPAADLDEGELARLDNDNDANPAI